MRQGHNEIITFFTHLREWIAESTRTITFCIKLRLAFLGVGFSSGLHGQFGHVELRDPKVLLLAIFGLVSLFALLTKRGDHSRNVQEVSAGVAWTVPNRSFWID